MTELPLVALGGLLGSSHCVGMCGGFAVGIGAGAATWRMNLLRQSTYGVGRIFTYTALGSAAGYFGRRVTASTTLFDLQSLLAVLTGVLLVVQGVRSAGLIAWFRERFGRGSPSPALAVPRTRAVAPPCFRRGMIGTLLSAPGVTGPFLAGVMTGFLPCGLVYAMLALAAGSGGLAAGCLTMLCFGLGTLPLMTAVGLGTSLVGLEGRRRMLQLAAWCVVAVGCLSLVRGASAWTAAREQPTAAPPACPLCRDSDRP